MSAATLAYPFAVYFSQGHLEPYWLALAVCLLGLVRAGLERRRIWLWAAAGGGLLALACRFGGMSWQPLKLYPVLVNGVFLALFAVSLVHPPTVVERLARLTDPGFSPAAIPYTRKVTQVWCGFFALNGSLALGTALWASNEVWTLYNGGIAYLAMATLFAGEWLVRRRVKARQAEVGAPSRAVAAAPAPPTTGAHV